MDSENNVIKLEPKIEINTSIKAAPKIINCIHKHVELDTHRRELSCAQCGAILDPFDFLYGCAVEENLHLSNISYLRKRIEVLEKKISRLDIEIINRTNK